MLMSTKEYLEEFEGATPEQRQEFIKDMSIEEAELLHDYGYDVFLNDGEVTKVVKNEERYAKRMKENKMIG